MKVLFVAVLIVLMPVLAWSAPFLVCDPQAGVTEYEIEVNGISGGVFPALPDGSASYDLVGTVAGTYTYRLRARSSTWPDWTAWSSPLDATKPAVPGNVRIQ